jgi:putative nucleotidyltransferase with HDIG domain
MAANAIEGELERIVVAKIEAGTMALPPLPSAAADALSRLRDPDVALRSVAAVIDRDPMLTVSILRTANSAALGGAPVGTIEQAVTRLGVQRTKTVVLETCARKIFTSRDNRIQRACEQIWEHSVAVAMLARDLASLAGADGESAYLVGLLHDIAKPIVAAYLLETEKVVTSRGARWIRADAWIDVMNRVSRPVAAAIAHRWELGEGVVAAIRALEDFDPSQRQAPANFVRFANAVTKLEGIYVGSVDMEATQALVMIGRSLLGIDDEVVQRMRSDLAERARRRVA